MAKVKGPLLSMDARGKIGKSLVFLGWKGLKTVRSYVVPANPHTSAQSIQRGYMTSAVAKWHSLAFNDLDLAAWNVLAGVQYKTMSGFNVFCKVYIFVINVYTTIVYPFGMFTSGNTGGSFSISVSAGGTTAARVKWGLSPSVMGSSAALTKVLTTDPYTGTVTGLTAGDYVYFRLYTETAGSFILGPIYKVLVLA
jgi:hypothetical protein